MSQDNTTQAQVAETYGPAQTPFQRLVNSGVISQGTRSRLEGIYRALDPVRLLRANFKPYRTPCGAME